MKGKREFSQTEAHVIRAKLGRLERAREIGEFDEAKRIRNNLRKQHEFYITHFGGYRFTVADFDKLVADGKIIIR